MKHTILAAFVACSVMAVTSMAHAYDGTIKFTGNITDDACQVNSGDADQTVPLGNVSTTSFGGAAGTQASGQKFKISLTGCPVSSKVSVDFSGNSDTTNTNLLKLDSGMTATGVAVRINDADGSQVKINDSASDASTTTDESGAATLNYVGMYQSTSDSVTAGTANATAQFTIIYN